MAASPIAAVRYPDGTTCLWRWTERPEDDRLAAFAAEFARARGSVRARIRASLDPGDVETLVGYARRCALAAVRTGDPAPLLSAFDALSAVDAARADSHDLAFGILALGSAASCVGLPMATATAGAMRRADPRVTRMLTSVACRPANSPGYRPVRTTGGTVLVYAAGLPYRPERDLVSILLGLASVFEAEGTYRVDELTLGSGTLVGWVGDRLDSRARELVDELTGCVSLRGQPVATPRDHHWLMVFVAESPTPEGAAAIAEGANRRPFAHAGVLGVAEGRLAAVVVVKAVRVRLRAHESPAEMARFLPAVHEALRPDNTLAT